MASVDTKTTLDGLFRIAYADEEKDLLPAFMHISEDIPFVQRGKLGELYRQPVILQGEHGITYAPPDAGAFTLSAPVASVMKKADAKGYQHLLRAAIDYEASFSGEGGTTSFKDTTSLVVMNMKKTVRKRLEIDFIYGNDDEGMAIVDGAPVANVITILTSSFAAGIWAGSVGAELEIFDSTGATQRTGIGSAGQYTIVSVDLDARTITVDDDQNVVSTDVIFFRTQTTSPAANFVHQSMAGFNKIITNTGTLFGISAATFADTWKGVVHDVGSTAFSLDEMQKGVAKLVARGAEDDLICYLNPVTWADINNDQAALVRYQGAQTTFENGSVGLKLRSQVGNVILKSHPYVKESHAFLVTPKLWIRKGATDATFNLGKQGLPGQFFRELTDQAGYELRCYSNQFIFTSMPARALKFKNIVNS